MYRIIDDAEYRFFVAEKSNRYSKKRRIAAGRLDLFFRPSTKLSDVVAGICMVRASGGKAVDYEGRDWTIDSEGVIAGSSQMVEAYLPCFR